jgi:hypothetical protein
MLGAADFWASGSSLEEAQAAWGQPSRDMDPFSAQEGLEIRQVTHDAQVPAMQWGGDAVEGVGWRE